MNELWWRRWLLIGWHDLFPLQASYPAQQSYLTDILHIKNIWNTKIGNLLGIRLQLKSDKLFINRIVRHLQSLVYGEIGLKISVSTNEWCFRPRFCTCKAILDHGQPGLMKWILLRIMPLVQDWSLDLLTSSPAPYHGALLSVSTCLGLSYISLQTSNFFTLPSSYSTDILQFICMSGHRIKTNFT